MARSSKNVMLPQEVINSRRNLNAAFGTVNNTLVFPPDMGTHFMMFRFREYSATRNNATAGTGFRTGDNRDRYTSSIVLPVPQDLRERFTAHYQERETGLLGGIILDAGSGASNFVRGLANGNGGDGTEMARFFSGMTGSQAATDVTAALMRNATQQAAERYLRNNYGSEAINAVNQLTGSVTNPNFVTAFYGVGLRRHFFQWLFSPESAQESKLLEDISKRLKYHMLPSNTTRYFLQYPDEVDITIGGSPEYNMPFKSCVVESVEFDYTPNGMVSKFKGTGAHTQISLRVLLLETEAFVREDINGGIMPGAAPAVGPR